MDSTPNFFNLRDPLSDSAFRGTVSSTEAYRVMMKAFRAEVVPENPIMVTHDMGRRLCDFVWISLEPVVHERVLDALTGAGLSGWTTYPVEVYDQKEQRVPGYHGFAITGRCESMFLDKEHSKVVYGDYPGGLFPSYQGLFVTTDSWDGSDFFLAADGKTGFRVATQRVANLFKRIKVTNVRLEPVSEVRGHASDQPAFPKQPKLSEQPIPTNNCTESALPEDSQEEVVALAGSALERLRAKSEQDPAEVVRLVSHHVDRVRPLSGDDLTEKALELGCLWAQQVVRSAGCIWVQLESPQREASPAIVSADRSLAILPMVYLRKLLEDEDEPNNSILLFNMVCAGNVPKAKPGAYLLLW